MGEAMLASVDRPKVVPDDFVATLHAYRGRPLFFDPLKGNNGDTLIRLGAERVLRASGGRLVGRPEDADVIVLNGGGAMNDIWKFAAELLSTYRRRCPETPVIVGPSSYFFERTDFAALCGEVRSPLTLFCRERYSHAYLASLGLPDHVQLGLSRDLALELGGGDLIESLRSASGERHVLIALRRDREGAEGLITRLRGGWLPPRVRKALVRIRDDWIVPRLAPSGRPGRIEAILEREGIPSDLPIIREDISRSVGFEAFCRTVAESALVITNRLHVAILGHMLDRRVVLFPGSYHKIRGVYEMSLAAGRTRLEA